jgi:hypothetical protein
VAQWRTAFSVTAGINVAGALVWAALASGERQI